MSITVRLWTETELKKAHTGEDRELTTLLLNKTTLSEQEARYYPYNLRRSYEALWMDEGEPVTIYAPDDEMVLWFIRQDYVRLPDVLYEVLTEYRYIELPRKGC